MIIGERIWHVKSIRLIVEFISEIKFKLLFYTFRLPGIRTGKFTSKVVLVSSCDDHHPVFLHDDVHSLQRESSVKSLYCKGRLRAKWTLTYDSSTVGDDGKEQKAHDAPYLASIRHVVLVQQGECQDQSCQCHAGILRHQTETNSWNNKETWLKL